jgi:hypothetical protein
MFLARPYLGPSGSLRRRDSLPPCRRNGSFLAGHRRSGFEPLHVELLDGSRGSSYAVQFILKADAFLPELTDDSLHQCFGHEGNVITVTWNSGAGLVNCRYVATSLIEGQRVQSCAVRPNRADYAGCIFDKRIEK